ncbi:MAG TPA: alpha/beta hydrolase [Jatrophihabitans sp.]|nr:alpha/beta hydrolase [Jatrophihabitans sp.]
MDDVLARNNVHQSGQPTGQPMLFAHGYGCDQAMWRFVTPMFEPDYRVVVFDHVGFGGSDLSAWNAQRYSNLSAYAEDLLELIGALDLHDVIYVGHSVAAMIGVLAANREPARFAHLVLVGPSARYLDDPQHDYSGGFSRPDIDDLLHTLEGNPLGWAASMAPVMMGNPQRPELSAELTASFCRTDPAVAATFARATFLSDNRADLSRVQTPCLVLQCSDDVIAPDSVGEFVHAHLPVSEFVHLRATGHCPNLSAPEETAPTIKAYLHRHSRPDADVGAG